MGIFRNITSLLEKARGKSRHTVTCERCMRGEEATHIVSSDVIHMRVCPSCAGEARKLGLTVKPIGRNQEAA